ncbi:ribosome maturation factor RimM [Helicobacter sp. 11S03491-1]|uniref:ribosome maturation factor RimM n=1 Tax=Helicobacter sp. 11S03491-1 TaxID=1476196 RepID=UPI000BA6767D|nr:ribosome maturation factor RimM [Helicobacter sp. 11S03491-1]PAF41174.1 16S rRNA processing protein RimM [Helicobacter sp. 11S03491-1]
MTLKNDISLIQIGKIGRTIGLHGGLKFHLITDFPQSIQKNLILTLEISHIGHSKTDNYTIKSFDTQNSIIFFEEITDIIQAKSLINAYAYASLEDTKKLCPLKKNEFFWFDLFDCEIIEEEEILGRVSDIQRIGATDYLLVATSEKLISQKLPRIFMIPYIQHFILQTSLEQKSIFVKGARAILEAS